MDPLAERRGLMGTTTFEQMSVEELEAKYVVAKEEMPDIIEWVCSPKYLNRGQTLYPRQATLLKLIFLQDDLFTDFDLGVLEEWSRGFRLPEPGEHAPPQPGEAIRYEPTRSLARGIPPDWETRLKMCKAEGRLWFREIVPIVGRRGGKGHVGALAGSRVLAHYITMWDPQDAYGIDRDKKLQAIVFAGKKEQARDNQWRDLANVITGAPWYAPLINRSLGEVLTVFAPSDRQRMIDMKAAGIDTAMDMATFEIVPKESTLMAGRGPASFMQYYDEMAHVVATGANRSATEVYGCLDPSTKILTADLEWKPISALAVGEQLVAMDERSDGRSGSPRKLQEAIVKAIWPTRKEAYRITFEDGSGVVCSGDHRWLRSESGSNSFKWATINIPAVRNSNSWSRLRVGQTVRHVVDPWEVDDTRDGGYLAGLLDGEGHVMFADRGSCTVGFTQNPGPILDAARDLLTRFGFEYQEVKKGTGSRCHTLNVCGVPACFRLLGQLGVERLRANMRYKWQGRKTAKSGKRIVSIESVGDRDLIDIETTTGTFLAEGFVSHNSATPSLDQFGVDAFIYEGSSPWQMTGQLYENYLEALSCDPVTRLPIRPEMLMVQLESWDLYHDWQRAQQFFMVPEDHKRKVTWKTQLKVVDPGETTKEGTIIDEVLRPDGPETKRKIVKGHRYSEYKAVCFPELKRSQQEYDDQMRRLERSNPDTFRVERRSQWQTVLDAYLDPAQIDEMFGPWLGETLPMKSRGALNIEYYAHGDPSKSGDNFGFAIGHTEGPDTNGLYHVVFDRLHAWQPGDYDEGRIDYLAIEQEIIDYAVRFHFTQLSFDQFSSTQMMQGIRSKLAKAGLPNRITIFEQTATAPLNWKMAETFKTAINLGLVHSPYYELADLELRFLQLNKNRVDHPSAGPVQTKDVADAMFNVVWQLIGAQMSAFLKGDLASVPVVGSVPGGLPVNGPVSSGNDLHDRLRDFGNSFGARPGIDRAVARAERFEQFRRQRERSARR
jgi:hypothetical protein